VTWAAGIPRRSAYRLRQCDAAFLEHWDDALEEALDDLEAELRRRALEGVERPDFYDGKECDTIRSYSDSLGMFLLKPRRGAVFAESQNHSQSARAGREVDDAKARLRDMLERMSDSHGSQDDSEDG